MNTLAVEAEKVTFVTLAIMIGIAISAGGASTAREVSHSKTILVVVVIGVIESHA